jgi:hypothetical protein
MDDLALAAGRSCADPAVCGELLRSSPHPVDASPDVVDVIEGVHAMLGGERFDHR